MQTSETYHYNTQEKQSVIELLAEIYPKCFFIDPKQRRPLKHNLVQDILNEHAVDVAPALLYTALDWYESNYGYKYQLQMGVKRIGLQGQERGTVTETEMLAAQKYVSARKTEMKEREEQKMPTMPKPLAVEKKPVHGFNSKLPMTASRLVFAKPIDTAIDTVKEETAMPKPIHDPLVPIQTLLDAVRGALTQPEPLRRPYLVAGLRVPNAEIEKTITTMEKQNG